MQDEYIRSARVKKVLSGDTVVLKVDLGFRIEATLACKLLGIATPSQGEYGFRFATLELVDCLTDCKDIIVQSISAEPCTGTFVGSIHATKDGARINVSRWMLENGFAIEWDGRGEKPQVPWPPLSPHDGGDGGGINVAQDNAEKVPAYLETPPVANVVISGGGQRSEPIIPQRSVDSVLPTLPNGTYDDKRRRRRF